MAYVLRTMQLAGPPTAPGSEPSSSTFPHIFVVGDAADAFGALNAGHTAWDQAGVAAHNIVALISNAERKNVDPVALQRYEAPPPAIKVSLGLVRTVRKRTASR